MNSDFGTLPSVLSGMAQPSTPHLASNITPQPQRESNPTPRPSIRPQQGHVYSLSGHVEPQQNGLDLGQASPNEPTSLRPGPYDARTIRRSRKFKRLRLLPYQECHRARFLCLEQDAELLMQTIQARIKQQ